MIQHGQEHLRATGAGRVADERERISGDIRAGNRSPAARLIAAAYGVCPDCGGIDECECE